MDNAKTPHIDGVHRARAAHAVAAITRLRAEIAASRDAADVARLLQAIGVETSEASALATTAHDGERHRAAGDGPARSQRVLSKRGAPTSGGATFG